MERKEVRARTGGTPREENGEMGWGGRKRGEAGEGQWRWRGWRRGWGVWVRG